MRVKLCFFVNVRNANGRRVAGGSIIGSMLALAGAGPGLKGLIGYAGVPKAGEEDGIGLNGPGVFGALKFGAARAFSP